MRVGLEAVDVSVGEPVLEAVSREVSERASTSSVFAGVNDLRLRLRREGGALLCVAVLGFAGGGLVTSTVKSDSALEAIVGALDGLPQSIDRQRSHARPDVAPSGSTHAAVRAQLERLLDRA
jgi:hypothetical protein